MTTSTDDTAATLAQKTQELADAQAAHDKATAESAGPRAPDVIITDLLEAIVMHGGNHPHQRALLSEFKAATERPATES